MKLAAASCLLFLILGLQSVSAQLAGTYTVGGAAPDFALFQDAADSLMVVGVSGPVDILVRPGVYTSPDSVNRVLYLSGPVVGASVTNRIRFAPDPAAGADRSNVILRRFGGIGEDGYVIGVKSSHTTIESFTAEVSDTSATRISIASVVSMSGNSNSGFRNLRVEGFGNRAHSGIHYTECGDDMFITGNDINRADWAVELWCQFPNRLIVADNYVTGVAAHHDAQAGRPDYAMLIQVSTAQGVRVEGNVVDFTGSGTAIGIGLVVFAGTGYAGLTVTGNRIVNWTIGGTPFGGGWAGYHLTGAGDGTMITNNTVSVTAGHWGSGLTPSGFNIYGYDGDVLVAHNSVYASGGAGGPFGIRNEKPNSSHLRFLNNIAVSENGRPAIGVNDTTNVEMDYNAYYSTGGLITTNFGSFATIGDWQATGLDEHSVQMRTEFEDDLTDLHLAGASVGDPNLIGTPLADVLFDMDGQPRDGALPYMGADEASPFPPGQPVARADQFRVFEGSVAAFDVLANDFDDQPLTIASLSTGGILGTASISQDGQRINYEPPSAFVGRDRFRYTARDTDGLPADAAVTVDVLARPADLIVSGVTVPPDAFSGDVVSVEFTVTNVGSGATRAPHWQDRISLSTTPDEAGQVLHQSVGNPTYLNSGDSYTTIQSLQIPLGLDGEFYVIVHTNSSGGQAETDAANNVLVSAETISIALTPPPDLQVTAISAPSTAFSGTDISVSYTVANAGPGPTLVSTWKDVLWGVDDEDRTVALATIERSGALDAGESYSATVTVTVPNALSGWYSITAETDLRTLVNLASLEYDRGNVFEHLLEGNNTRSDSLEVFLSPSPDLVPIAVSVPPTASAGKMAAFSWTVENQGAGAPFETSWSDRVYLSADVTLETSTDILLGSVRITTPPNANATYTGSANFRLPVDLSGSFFAIVVSDANKEVFETQFDNNNALTSLSAVNVTIPPLPDLFVKTVSAPAAASAGGTLFVGWTVTNEGAASADGAWKDRVYLSTEQTLSASAVEIGQRGCNPCAGVVGSDYSTGLEVLVPADLVAGQYHVIVSTDADNQVFENEGDGDNTTASAAVDISGYPPTDLVVEELFLSSATLESGSELTIDWVVRNAGGGATRANRWTDRVYLSADEQLNPSEDLLLTDVQRREGLGGNASYSRSVPAIIPQSAEGTFFVIAATDAASQIPEQNDANNTRVSGAVVIEPMVPSDLRPLSLQGPVEAAAGQPITVTWTVVNQGAGATSGSTWYDALYLSDVSSWTLSARRIGTKEHTGFLDPDSTYTDSLEITIPAFASGAQFLLFESDSGKDIFEASRESNNIRSTQISIVLNDPSDLVVSSVTAPANAIPGEGVTVEYTVTNQGTFEARGFVLDGVYVSSDSSWDIEDRLVGIAGTQLNLPPGGSQRLMMKVDVGATLSETTGQIVDDLPGVLPGDYRLIARTDLRNAIRETDERNNDAAAPAATAVSLEELPLQSPVSFGLAAGQRKYFALVSDGGQDLRLTLTGADASLANDIFVAFERMPGPEDFDIGPSAPSQADQELFVPTTKAGTYYVMTERRMTGSGIEQVSLLAEALGFTLLSVSPDNVGAGGRVTTTVRGAGFDENTTVRLDRPSSVSVSGDVVAVVSSNEMKVNWELGGVPAGDYEIVAEKQSVESRLPFRVQPHTSLVVDIQQTGSVQIRARRPGQFTFVVTNVSNVNIPYLEGAVIIPGDLQVQQTRLQGRVETEADVDRRTLQYLEELTGITGKVDLSELPENYRAYSEGSADTVTVVPVRVVDMAPGERFSISVTISGFRSEEEVAILFRHAALDVDQFASALCSTLDGSRRQAFDIEGLSSDELAYVNDKHAYFSDALGFLDTIEYVSSHDKERILDTCVSGSQSSVAQSARGLSSTTPLASFAGLRSIAGSTEWAGEGAGPALERCYFYQHVSCWFFANLECALVGANFGGAFAAKVFLTVAGRTLPIWAPSAFVCKKVLGKVCKEFGDFMCRQTLQAYDPNDISGPAGYGDERWVPMIAPLPYAIRFENDPVKASAPAQEVLVTQQLDSTLDWRSFRLGDFGFGGRRFSVPENSASYQTRLDVRDSLELFVDVTAGIDVSTGTAFWRFESVDPFTGELPWFDGFLPPNDTLGRGTGEGFVNYSVRSRPTATTRDVVNAKARIIFDANEPIDTPPYFNTIDAEPPSTRVQSLSASSDTSNFSVTWSRDDFGGSDTREFTLYVSENGNPFEVYRSGITNPSTVFAGEYDKEYAFFVVGTDNAGNVEPLKSAAEASTMVVRTVGVDSDDVPIAFALHQNYPNPFRGRTTIPFDLEQAGEVEIVVFDLIGRRVVRADQGGLPPGRYNAAFDFSRLASGLYLYRIKVSGEGRTLFEEGKSFVVLK